MQNYGIMIPFEELRQNDRERDRDRANENKRPPGVGGSRRGGRGGGPPGGGSGGHAPYANNARTPFMGAFPQFQRAPYIPTVVPGAAGPSAAAGPQVPHIPQYRPSMPPPPSAGGYAVSPFGAQGPAPGGFPPPQAYPPQYMQPPQQQQQQYQAPVLQVNSDAVEAELEEIRRRRAAALRG